MDDNRTGKGDCGEATEAKPIEVDVMEEGYEAFLGDMAVDVCVKLEELDPADPGELSGAKISVLPREEPTLNVTLGSHYLGLVAGAPLFRFLSECVDVIEQGPAAKKACAVRLASCQPIDGKLSPFELELAGAPAPSLKIVATGGGHCFGVLRGEALRRFLEVGLARAAFGRSVPPEHLAIAFDTLKACFGAIQDLGQRLQVHLV